MNLLENSLEISNEFHLSGTTKTFKNLLKISNKFLINRRKGQVLIRWKIRGEIPTNFPTKLVNNYINKMKISIHCKNHYIFPKPNL